MKDAEYWTEWNLSNWAKWMQHGGLPDGCPKEACGGLENYTTVDLDNEKAYESLDERLAEATNAAIDDLQPASKSAIYREYGILKAYSGADYVAVLRLAKLEVREGLRLRNVWLGE